MEVANAFDAGLFEGDIALSLEDIVEMQALEAVRQLTHISMYTKIYTLNYLYIGC